jgi:putative Ca2+/H+ antiporter (TMEM165/GDT1 family)
MHSLMVSFAAISLGELGDKTQLLALLLATRLRAPVAVLCGILVATLANHLIACLVGQWAGTLLNPQLLRWTLGISFLLLAAWVLVPDKADPEGTTRSGYGAFALTAITFFLAEMGDKTQLLTVALAARYQTLLPVLTGTVCGMLVVDVPTVLLAGHLTRVLPLRWIRIAAALIYLVLGATTLLGGGGIGGIGL